MIVSTAAVAASIGWPVAVIWHLGLAVLCVGLWRGWRPAVRTLALLLTTPLLSVSVFAAIAGNPFNAVVFAAFAAWCASAAFRCTEPISLGSSLEVKAGAAFVGFGWVYPHFLPFAGWVYLIAAPVGVVPCPTLAVLVGLALMVSGAGWGRVRTGLAIAALAYGIVGVWMLRVGIDVALIAGALLLLLTPGTRAVHHTSLHPEAAT